VKNEKQVTLRERHRWEETGSTKEGNKEGKYE
jgi:hypothetical protein